MNLETEYDINDEVWYVHPGTQKATTGNIIGIQLSVKSKEIMKTGRVGRSLEKTGVFKPEDPTIVYTINSHLGPWASTGVAKRPGEIAKSKNDLIKILKKQAENI